MKSFDEIKSLLERELHVAMDARERDFLHQRQTSEAMLRAIDRYKRFVLHGVMPEDLADDEGGI